MFLDVPLKLNFSSFAVVPIKMGSFLTLFPSKKLRSPNLNFSSFGILGGILSGILVPSKFNFSSFEVGVIKMGSFLTLLDVGI